MLHSFRIPFPKNTWKAASVRRKTNFEKWEKIRLDHDENVWKFRLIIETQTSYSDSYLLFQVITHSNLLFNNDTYKKSLSALWDLSYGLEMKFMSDVTFSSWPGKSVNPNFRQYQSYRNKDKFNCCCNIQPKTTKTISICTLNPLKLPSNKIYIWCQFAVVAR